MFLLPAADEPHTRPMDILRTTVQLRHGEHRGSGTIIASSDGETLVLTAAHVVKGATDLKVELHRHNLGFNTTGLTEGGGWPRLVKAGVVASDSATDIALVRIERMVALPYVARVDLDAKQPTKGETLTSIGIDRGLHLTTWQTGVEGITEIDIHQGGGPRLYTVTTRYPEHGRSGGGLFRPDGSLVGLCTGQLSVPSKSTRVGLFAALPYIQKFLREQNYQTPARVRPKQESPTGRRSSG